MGLAYEIGQAGRADAFGQGPFFITEKIHAFLA